MGDDLIFKLIIGGAQFGLNYGVANNTGQVSRSEIVDMLELAASVGIGFVDTARAYGDSELNIGVALSNLQTDYQINVITKLSPFAELSDPLVDDRKIDHLVESCLLASKQALRVSKLDTVLLHRAEFIRRFDGSIWRSLKKYKHQGAVGRIGASIQNIDELLIALADQDVSLIQMPLNILDSRFDEAIDKIIEVKSQRPLIIHARSVFLQGLLLTDQQSNWEKANVGSYSEVIAWLESIREQAGCKDKHELCLRYIASIDWVDGVVVGLDSLSQLKQTINVLRKGSLEGSVYDLVSSTRPPLREATLNPALWSLGNG